MYIYLFICTYKRSNIIHVLIFIGSMKGIMSRSKLTKTACQDLADFVSNRYNICWDSKTMSRFRAYIKLYNETKKEVEDNSGVKFTY